MRAARRGSSLRRRPRWRAAHSWSEDGGGWLAAWNGRRNRTMAAPLTEYEAISGARRFGEICVISASSRSPERSGARRASADRARSSSRGGTEAPSLPDARRPPQRRRGAGRSRGGDRFASSHVGPALGGTLMPQLDAVARLLSAPLTTNTSSSLGRTTSCSLRSSSPWRTRAPAASLSSSRAWARIASGQASRWRSPPPDGRLPRGRPTQCHRARRRTANRRPRGGSPRSVSRFRRLRLGRPAPPRPGHGP